MDEINMNDHSEWIFPETIEEASEIQLKLKEKVHLKDDFGELKSIGGLDCSNMPRDPKKQIFAGLISLHPKKLIPLSKTFAQGTTTFPYISGYLAFREIPILLKVLSSMELIPDLLMIDGHGISHPRGLGIASHLGVLLDRPTIGVGKTILVGAPEKPLGENFLDQTPLIWKGRKVGTLLRTKKKSNPLVISPGHKISHETAVSLVIDCLKGYRLPEPTRLAHLGVNVYRKSF